MFRGSGSRPAHTCANGRRLGLRTGRRASWGAVLDLHSAASSISSCSKPGGFAITRSDAFAVVVVKLGFKSLS